MDSRGLRKAPQSIDEYIGTFPKDIQSKLESIRKAVKEEAPDAQEVMSYGMPAFKLNKVLVYFVAQKKHIGFYPTASGISAFKEELSQFKHSKGAVQFPIDEPVPLELVRKMVKFRVKEDMAKAKREGRK
ncbi:MAG: DUF1801 domain-containing protein [Methanomassiliicoccales archaeon]|nr:DUF1801 domain-containing protein [Methanomassiliicoccales archaeon]MDD1755976.1 DUF1801 domain-containing protein [Methanomassiliicoccales archaeon]